jgi:hypothetical protein
MLENPALHRCMQLPILTPSDDPFLERKESDPPRVISSVYQSRGWWEKVYLGKDCKHRETSFYHENDRRNIVISLFVDAFAPFKNKKTYSITVIAGQLLNLPENLRHQARFMILAGLTSGGVAHKGGKAPKTMYAYLKYVVEELNKLYNDPIEYKCPNTGRKCQARVKVLYVCGDYPAHCKNNFQQGANAKWGCHKCEVRVS